MKGKALVDRDVDGGVYTEEEDTNEDDNEEEGEYEKNLGLDRSTK